LTAWIAFICYSRKDEKFVDRFTDDLVPPGSPSARR
jgi:hypothetical protein